MGRDSFYQSKWEFTYPWLTHVMGERTKAFCQICPATFSIKDKIRLRTMVYSIGERYAKNSNIIEFI